MLLAILFFVAGIVISSFLGDLVHRLIHKKWIPFLHESHMYHHEILYPATNLTSDKYKAAPWYKRGTFLFTPFALLASLLFGYAAFVLVGFASCITLLVGLIGYGFVNDWVHDTFHLKEHKWQKYRYYRTLRTSHFKHHVDMTKNYGIISLYWDKKFNSKR